MPYKTLNVIYIYISQLLRSTIPGCPPFDVSMEEVECLRSLRLSWPKIAEIWNQQENTQSWTRRVESS